MPCGTHKLCCIYPLSVPCLYCAVPFPSAWEHLFVGSFFVCFAHLGFCAPNLAKNYWNHLHLREWVRVIVGLGRYLVHTDQKKCEMLSAGRRTGRCFSWTGFIWNQSIALQLELSLAFSSFTLGNTVYMGTSLPTTFVPEMFLPSRNALQSLPRFSVFLWLSA